MAHQPTLDEEYTSGVYYDVHTGEFVEIQESDKTISLVAPGESDPYYTFDEDGLSKAEAIQSVEDEMTRVSEVAVENPRQVVEEHLRRRRPASHDRVMAYTSDEEIDLMYAREQVKIVEE